MLGLVRSAWVCGMDAASFPIDPSSPVFFSPPPPPQEPTKKNGMTLGQGNSECHTDENFYRYCFKLEAKKQQQQQQTDFDPPFFKTIPNRKFRCLKSHPKSPLNGSKTCLSSCSNYRWLTYIHHSLLGA